MGRNNLENRSKDKNWGYNITQKATIKFELLNESDCRNIEASMGFDLRSVTMAIKCNANYQINLKDKLNIKGKQLQVVYMQPYYDNDNQARYKASLNDYTGEMVVGLS